MTPPERILPAALRRALATDRLGRRIYYVPEVDSTNRLALDLARLGEADGTVVLTEYQSKGRGRKGRVWVSPANRNLLFTLILRPDRSARSLLPITLAFSLAIAEALSEITGSDVGVAWPNDVVSPAGKICGILSEAATRGRRSAFVVVGIGINVNMRREEFTPPAGRGASCHTLTGSELDRCEVLARVLAALEATYERFTAEGFAPFVERYTRRLTLLDRPVAFGAAGAEKTGTAVGVEADGGLIVEMAGGKRAVVYDQEVRPR